MGAIVGHGYGSGTGMDTFTLVASGILVTHVTKMETTQNL
jgi:hypothetical protein